MRDLKIKIFIILIKIKIKIYPFCIYIKNNKYLDILYIYMYVW